MRFSGVIDSRVALVLEREKPTLKDALIALSLQYGKKFEDMVFEPYNKEVKRSVLILLNSQPYLNLAERLDTQLRDGDEITLTPLMVGG